MRPFKSDPPKSSLIRENFILPKTGGAREGHFNLIYYIISITEDLLVGKAYYFIALLFKPVCTYSIVCLLFLCEVITSVYLYDYLTLSE